MNAELAQVETKKANQLVELDLAEQKVGELRSLYAGLEIKDLSDREGFDAVSTGRKAVKAVRVNLEKSRKAMKAPFLDMCQQIDAKAKEIREELLAIESPLEEKEKEYLAWKEEEKRRKENELLELAMERTAKLQMFGQPAPPDIGYLSEGDFEGMLKQAEEDHAKALIEKEKAAKAAAEREAELLAAKKRLEEERLEQERKQEEERNKLEAKIAEEKRIAEEKLAEERRKQEEILEAARKEAEKKLEEERKAREAEQAELRRLQEAEAERQRKIEEEARIKAEEEKREACQARANDLVEDTMTLRSIVDTAMSFKLSDEAANERLSEINEEFGRSCIELIRKMEKGTI